MKQCNYCGDDVPALCADCAACADCCDCDEGAESFDSDEFGEDPEAEYERRFET